MTTTPRPFVCGLRDAIVVADLPAMHKLLLFTLSTYSSVTGSCRPSQSLLAKNIASSPRTVKRLIADLKRSGWLVVTEQGTSGKGRGGVRRANVYQLAFGHALCAEAPKPRPVPLKVPPKLSRPVPARVPVRVPEPLIVPEPDEETRILPFVRRPPPMTRDDIPTRRYATAGGFGVGLSVDDLLD